MTGVLLPDGNALTHDSHATPLSKAIEVGISQAFSS